MGFTKKQVKIITYLSIPDLSEQERCRANLIKKFGIAWKNGLEKFLEQGVDCRKWNGQDVSEPTYFLSDKGKDFIERMKEKESEEKYKEIQENRHRELIKTQRNAIWVQAIITIILIGVTIFYAFQTYNLNEISQEQFQIVNRPYMKITDIVESDSNITGSPMFNVKIENVGKFAGMVETLNFTFIDYNNNTKFTTFYLNEIIGAERYFQDDLHTVMFFLGDMHTLLETEITYKSLNLKDEENYSITQEWLRVDREYAKLRNDLN